MISSAISGLIARMRSLARGLRGRADVESEMDEEFRHHLRLRTEDLVRQGLRPREAARRARIEFGHVESHKEVARSARGLWAFDQIRFSWLDVKVGFRMLARYPGLTIVAGLTMAFAIGLGAAMFEVIKQRVDPTLPLPEGDRIVALSYHHRAENARRSPRAYDLLGWRNGLTTVEDVGGYRSQQRNLSLDGAAAVVEFAEISAAAFRVTRTRAMLGRTLVESDEAPQAPAVVVLGHRLWQTRFHGDANVLGRQVLLGDARATVVGVMPEGFGFPYNHSMWMPLRLSDFPGQPGMGPTMSVVGRLAPGATLEQAQAELLTRTSAAAIDFPQHYGELTPQVMSYSARYGIPDLELRAGLYGINVLGVLFLVLLCGNVALLMFSRAATREREIVVRNALGAGRARIVAQFFVEALVLGLFAAALGLYASRPVIRAAMSAIIGASEDQWPFWVHASLSPSTAMYATLLTLLATVIAGVVPALRVTGPALENQLRAASAGGGGIQMSGTWRAMVMSLIAATMVFAALSYPMQVYARKRVGTAIGFPVNEYVAVRFEMDADHPLELSTDSGQQRFLARYAARIEELKRRVAADPAVAGVTVARELPLMDTRLRVVEVDGWTSRDTIKDRNRHYVISTAVDLEFFDVFDAPLLAGRAFDSRDQSDAANTVIVNEAFVRRVLGGRNAVGQRIRQPGYENVAPGPWYEIIGVVPDLMLDDVNPLDLDEEYRAQFYLPLGRGLDLPYPLHFAVHARGDLASLTPMMHRLAGEVSPTLRIDQIQPLDQVGETEQIFWIFWSRFLWIVMGISIFLTMSGIYSVMAFSVSRQTREIGIRVALGAAPARVVREILRSPIRLVATGIAVGTVPVAAFLGLLVWSAKFRLETDAMLARVTPAAVALFVAVALTIMGVSALACIVPTRRALGVQPTEALREEV